jgi:hypothetical protein
MGEGDALILGARGYAAICSRCIDIRYRDNEARRVEHDISRGCDTGQDCFVSLRA